MVRHRLLRAFVAAGLFAAQAGCATQPKGPTSKPPPSGSSSAELDEVPSPPGVFKAEGQRSLQLALYTTEPLSAAVREDIVARAAKRLPGVTVVTSMDESPPAGNALLVLQPSIEDLPIASGEQFALFSRGIPASDVPRVKASRGVVMLGLRLTKDPGLKLLREARRLVAEIATEQRGTIWTQSARLLFAPDAWAERDAGWEGDVPDVREHISIHYYEIHGRHRAITLGLEQFGVPDLVLEDVPMHQSSAAGVLINVCAQLLIEGAATDERGRIEIDFGAIRHRGMRTFATSSQVGEATGRAAIRLVPGAPDEGDPDNRLAELVFHDHEGATAPERQSAALTALVGIDAPAIVGVQADDPELAAVKKKAQARIPEFEKMMKKGMPLGQQLAVKGPFPTDEGSQEWMWIEVVAWRDGAAYGSLMNTPVHIAKLKLGAKVWIPAADISDYLLTMPDGEVEGGQSAEILQRRRATAP